LVKRGCQLGLRDCVRIDGRREPIRHQRLQTTNALPITEDGWLADKLGQKSLVVAFEKDHPMRAIAGDQSVQDPARIWSTIDVIAKKDFKAIRNRSFCQIGIDVVKHPVEQIRAAMDVADSINANAIGHSRLLVS